MQLTMLTSLLLTLALLPFYTAAQFQGNFFEQMFQAQQHQQQQPREDAPSNSDHYQAEFDSVHCAKYLCPGTLACVHFPHHCPCAFPNVEDKVELGEGIAVCASKGGYKQGETLRKIELARKGVL